MHRDAWAHCGHRQLAAVDSQAAAHTITVETQVGDRVQAQLARRAGQANTISQRREGDSDALDCDLTKSGYYYVSMGYKPQRTQVRGSEHRNATEATCGMRWGVMTDCTVCNGEHLHASVWVSGTSPIIAASVRLSN